MHKNDQRVTFLFLGQDFFTFQLNEDSQTAELIFGNTNSSDARLCIAKDSVCVFTGLLQDEK